MDLKQAGRQLDQLRDKIDSLEDQFEVLKSETEDYLKERFFAAWMNKFPDYRPEIIAYSDGQVSFYSVIGNRRRVQPLEAPVLTWGLRDPDNTSAYGLETTFDLDPVKVSEFFTEFETTHPGGRVKPVCLKVRNPLSPGTIRSFKAIVSTYSADSKVSLHSKGERHYIGWDISDPWIIVIADGVKHAWRSMEAHGGPLEHYATEGDHSWADFESWLSDPNN